MTVVILFVIIIAILVADFGLERFLSLLNMRYSKKPLPDILKDIYNGEQYRKQQDYYRANVRFGIYSRSFGFLITLSMYAFGGFGFLDNWLDLYTGNEILRALSFFGILYIANDLISIPFDCYDTFVIEEKFGFNKTTPKTFVLDKLKSYLLSALIGGGLIALIMWIYMLTPAYFWFFAWAAITAFSLFMSLFYSQLIVPLFNKQTPLPEGELREAIESFAKKAGFKLNNIFLIDSSKRSTKANAYFTGFGPKKRIVLFDTLIDKLSTDEIVAVLAHEMGHSKHKHTLKGLLVSLPTSLLMFYLLGIMLKSDVLSQAMGVSEANFEVNVLAFGILYSPVSLVLDLLGNYLSRRHEYQADRYAAKNALADELISGLKKLSASSLSNLMPHPVYVFFHYSHPTLYQRITCLKSLNF